MFEDVTYEGIKGRVTSGFDFIDTREGSVTGDVIAPVSLELWKVYKTMEGLIRIVYIDKTSGKYIDMRAEEIGLVRKEGTKATAVIHFTGKDGLTIPANTAFYTKDGLKFCLQDDVTLDGGSGDGVLEANAVGESYNVEAGEIVSMLRNISGLTTFTNDAAEGGTEAETDEALCKRFYNKLQKPATSGNIWHYYQWCMEIDGVGAAKIRPLWNGNGTVQCLLADSSYGPVSDDILEAVVAHIEEERPIGPTVSVVSVESLSISASATITTDGGTTADTACEKWKELIDAYLQGLAAEYMETTTYADYKVRINEIGALLLDVSGVTDYEDLAINGGTGNVTVAANQVPAIGEVSLNVE